MAGKINYPWDIQKMKRMQKNKEMKKKRMKEREKMYARIETKFHMTNEDIREKHEKFLKDRKSGEMSKRDFIKYAKKEKKMTSYLSQALFRVFDEDGSGTIDFEEFMMLLNFKNSTFEEKIDWIFKVFDEDGGGTIDLDEVIKIVIGLYNMNGEQVDREVMLACVMELMEVLDEDGNGLITREEFIENGLKSGFVLNLMEYFEDVPDPEPEKCKKPRCRKKCRCKPKDEDEDGEDEDYSSLNQAEEDVAEAPGAADSPNAPEP